MNGNMLMACGSSVSTGGEIDSFDPFGDGSGKALYRLEGNALDESGNYNGTAKSVTYGDGVYQRGAILATASSLIYHVGMSLDLTNASMSIWVNVGTTMPTGNSFPFFIANGTVEFGILVSKNYNNIACSCTGSNVFKASTVQTQIPNSAWHHIVLTKAGTTLKIYLDNVLLTLVNQGSGTFGVTAGIGLGGYSTGAASGFAGKLDQARFFNRAITATEVATLYTEI